MSWLSISWWESVKGTFWIHWYQDWVQQGSRPRTQDIYSFISIRMCLWRSSVIQVFVLIKTKWKPLSCFFGDWFHPSCKNLDLNLCSKYTCISGSLLSLPPVIPMNFSWPLLQDFIQVQNVLQTSFFRKCFSTCTQELNQKPDYIKTLPVSAPLSRLCSHFHSLSFCLTPAPQVALIYRHPLILLSGFTLDTQCDAFKGSSCI